jgi:hypothetical protein
MITDKSSKREIKDLQRLLLAAGLMEFTNSSKSGKWGVETQAAVLRAYSRLGWDHDEDDRWISAPALAAVAAILHQHDVAPGASQTSGGLAIGGGGSNIGGGGSNIGGGGSNIGGGGSNIGGGGSNIGGGGSNIGGGGSPE